MRYKNLKISSGLFFKIIRYVYMDQFELKNEIIKEIDEKMKSINEGDWFTEMKIGETPEIRKEGKEKYMDSKGIHPDFRWDD